MRVSPSSLKIKSEKHIVQKHSLCPLSMCISKVLTSRISSPHHKAHYKACHFTVIEDLCKMLTASCCSHSDLHSRQIRDWQWMQNECWTQVYSGHKKDLNWGGANFWTGFNQFGCLVSHSSMSLQKCNLPKVHCTQQLQWMLIADKQISPCFIFGTAEIWSATVLLCWLCGQILQIWPFVRLLNHTHIWRSICWQGVKRSSQ